MTKKAFQDYYPDDLNHCYGCGSLNEHGLKIKSYWDGEESVCIHTPNPHFMAIPGYAYGGLIASLIDCHSTGTAAAAKYRAENREMDTLPPLRFLTEPAAERRLRLFAPARRALRGLLRRAGQPVGFAIALVVPWRAHCGVAPEPAGLALSVPGRGRK